GADVSRLKLSPELTGDAAQNVVIRLSQSSVGETIAAAAVTGASVSSTEQVAQAAAVEQQQSAVVAQLQQLDSSARVLGTTQVALNAVLANATPATLAELAKNPAVIAIRPVKN